MKIKEQFIEIIQRIQANHIIAYNVILLLDTSQEFKNDNIRQLNENTYNSLVLLSNIDIAEKLMKTMYDYIKRQNDKVDINK